MSGGSQHNPNGRQSQMSSGWSPLQLQMANLLARAPQAHMASERGVTWHTPTPPPHLYHVPVPSPPHLQAIKGAAANSVFRHTATPPELFRHTPTPPDKHLLRHTPSPGEMKAGPPISPADLYPHLGPTREKLRPEELLAAAYARGGVDLSISRTANGSPSPVNAPPVNIALPVNAAPALSAAPAPPPPVAPALSVRDAPTINSLIARAGCGAACAGAAGAGAAARAGRVDALMERLAPAHSVIVQRRAPSPPSSNEDSVDSNSGVGSGKRKRKPERTVRLPGAAMGPGGSGGPGGTVGLGGSGGPGGAPHNGGLPAAPPHCDLPPRPRISPPHSSMASERNCRAGSAETIAEIAAMIASKEPPPAAIDLQAVLADQPPDQPPDQTADQTADQPARDAPGAETAAAPKRHNRNSNSESANVPVESPSEAAEPEPSDPRNVQPTPASIVEVENQLKKMFAGLEEEEQAKNEAETSEENKVVESGEKEETQESEPVQTKRRRKSAPTKGDPAHRKKQSSNRRSSATDGPPRRKQPRNKSTTSKKKTTHKEKDAYDSGSNASSSKSRGPYIQVRVSSVAVVNAEEEPPRPPRAGGGGGARGGGGGARGGGGGPPRNGLRARGLHASTLSHRYDATTPDATWLCAFCNRGPHAESLGDLFGPYTISTDCEEYRGAAGAGVGAGGEVWFHAACGVWAPGLLAAGARLWGLDDAVRSARASRCAACGGRGAGVACAARACGARAHVPCAARWRLQHDQCRALCPAHAHLEHHAHHAPSAS